MITLLTQTTIGLNCTANSLLQRHVCLTCNVQTGGCPTKDGRMFCAGGNLLFHKQQRKEKGNGKQKKDAKIFTEQP